ncbi:MAG TPA: methyltransferase domain-containing protein [Thermodesulfovibrionales bacterium]|jgi:SAM-dependent methyltransferase|nr:methyltransferase domain-containing protein [Thermodesulfovibrionales bacterium]
MDELSKEYVISFFEKTLAMHGDRPESVGWNARGQPLHYEALLDIGNIEGAKILDFGCGRGDFYRFLKDRNISVDYTGLDINERMISLAREKFPECRFGVLDSEKNELTEEFDYIFLCGVFNLKVQGLDETIKETIERLFRRTRIALAFNALSAHNPRKDCALHYIFPEEIFQFAVKNLSPTVSLRHDRMAYDFVIFVYREINGFSV